MSIDFVDQTTGLMFRGDRYFLKSTNSGETWSENIINIMFPGIKQGMFYSTTFGAFSPGPFITTNGGNSWFLNPPPTMGSYDIQCIYIQNDSIIFLNGIDVDILDGSVDPVIYKSTNKGNNWTEVDRGGGANNYADIIFINDNTGFECRFTIKKTTDSGNTWFAFSQKMRQRVEFSQVFSDTMYLSSADGYVAKSVNLGANWVEYHTGVNDHLNDIFFLNNQTGFAVGHQGGIVKTTNGGVNWVVQNSGTTKRLNEIWFINNDTGFIAGDSGLLLVTYNGGVTSLIQNSQSIPVHFTLDQNYPNPFNPSTKIKFDIPRSSFVKLTVHDILGREAAKLVNEDLSAGSYEYEFDGTGLNSGVYFYRIEAGEYMETRRMVLLK